MRNERKTELERSELEKSKKQGTKEEEWSSEVQTKKRERASVRVTESKKWFCNYCWYEKTPSILQTLQFSFIFSVHNCFVAGITNVRECVCVERLFFFLRPFPDSSPHHQPLCLFHIRRMNYTFSSLHLAMFAGFFPSSSRRCRRIIPPYSCLMFETSSVCLCFSKKIHLILFSLNFQFEKHSVNTKWV